MRFAGSAPGARAASAAPRRAAASSVSERAEMLTATVRPSATSSSARPSIQRSMAPITSSRSAVGRKSIGGTMSSPRPFIRTSSSSCTCSPLLRSTIGWLYASRRFPSTARVIRRCHSSSQSSSCSRSFSSLTSANTQTAPTTAPSSRIGALVYLTANEVSSGRQKTSSLLVDHLAAQRGVERGLLDRVRRPVGMRAVQQLVRIAAHQLGVVAAEDLARRRVRVGDPALGIDADDSLADRPQDQLVVADQLRQLPLPLFLGADVAGDQRCRSEARCRRPSPGWR